VTSGFNVFAAPNGGFLMALLMRAMRNEQELRQNNRNKDCQGMQVSFLSSAAHSQPCEVHVQVLKRGRTLSWLRAELRQKNKLRLTCNSVFGKYHPSGAQSFAGKVDLPPPDEIKKDFNLGQETLRTRQLFNRWRFRSTQEFEAIYMHLLSLKRLGRPCPPCLKIYIGHELDEPMTVESLAAISDSVIPTVKALRPWKDSAWVPTMTFDLQVFAAPRPETKWIKCHFRLEANAERRNCEVVELFEGSSDRLLARGIQSALTQAQQTDKSKM